MKKQNNKKEAVELVKNIIKLPHEALLSMMFNTINFICEKNLFSEWVEYLAKKDRGKN